MQEFLSLELDNSFHRSRLGHLHALFSVGSMEPAPIHNTARVWNSEFIFKVLEV